MRKYNPGCVVMTNAGTKTTRRPGVVLSSLLFVVLRLESSTMVVSIIQTFRNALKYRGGWRGLLEHMYAVSYG
jgi:hypothetical protein